MEMSSYFSCDYDLSGSDDVDDVCPDATMYASEKKAGERRPVLRSKSNTVLCSGVLQTWTKTSTKEKS
eukprot:853772-Ditylum_brightwellii.AAC.1